jgi:hypothetical protein
MQHHAWFHAVKPHPEPPCRSLALVSIVRSDSGEHRHVAQIENIKLSAVIEWTRTRLALLVAVTVAWVPASAGAVERATVSTSLKPNGSGFLITNGRSNPEDQTWAWQACSARLSSCTPFGKGRTISTNGAKPNTRFRATSSYGVTGVSSIWRGRVKPLGPPTITGIVRANERVTPVAGLWQGGWSDDYDLFQLAVCESSKGLRCTTLTDVHYPGGCPHGAAVLDPQFTGNYLRIADRRIGAGTAFLDFAVPTPYEGRIWAADRTTSVTIVGRIAKATGPRTVKCGPPPLSEAP